MNINKKLRSVLRMIQYTLFSFPILFFPELAFAQARHMRGWFWTCPMGSWGMGWPGHIFMFAVWILIIVLLVLVIRWLFRSMRNTPGNTSANNSKAIEILEERFAKGEIDEKEFEEKKKHLL